MSKALPTLLALCLLLPSAAVFSEDNGFTDADGVVYEDASKTVLLKCPPQTRGHFAIPGGVVKVDPHAFDMCDGLTSISIPASVRDMDFGKSLPAGPAELVAFEVDPENKNYSSRDGVLFDKIHSMVLRCPPGKSGHYAIPRGVIDIHARAFAGCSRLTSISFPEGVANLHKYAFEGCTGLQRLDLPRSLYEIHESAFSGCTGLKELVIPERVVQIEGEAFSGCTGLETVTISEGIVYIGKNAFAGCQNLKHLQIPQDFHEDLESLGFPPALAAKIRSGSN